MGNSEEQSMQASTMNIEQDLIGSANNHQTTEKNYDMQEQAVEKNLTNIGQIITSKSGDYLSLIKNKNTHDQTDNMNNGTEQANDMNSKKNTQTGTYNNMSDKAMTMRYNMNRHPFQSNTGLDQESKNDEKAQNSEQRISINEEYYPANNSTHTINNGLVKPMERRNSNHANVNRGKGPETPLEMSNQEENMTAAFRECVKKKLFFAEMSTKI